MTFNEFRDPMPPPIPVTVGKLTGCRYTDKDGDVVAVRVNPSSGYLVLRADSVVVLKREGSTRLAKALLELAEQLPKVTSEVPL